MLKLIYKWSVTKEGPRAPLFELKIKEERNSDKSITRKNKRVFTGSCSNNSSCFNIMLHFSRFWLDDICFFDWCYYAYLWVKFFNLGADSSMMKLGEQIGQFVTKKKNIWILIGVTAAIGLIITIAEPDLMVLAEQMQHTIPKDY